MFLTIVLNCRTLNDRINMICVESIERNIRNDCSLETGKLANGKLVNGAILIATEEMIGKLNENY